MDASSVSWMALHSLANGIGQQTTDRCHFNRVSRSGLLTEVFIRITRSHGRGARDPLTHSIVATRVCVLKTDRGAMCIVEII